MKRRIFYQRIALYILVIVIIVCHKWIIPPKTLTEEILADSLGLFVISIGFLFRTLARAYKWKYYQTSSLATTHIYALSRNPMYLGTFLIGLGAVIMMLSWIFLPFYLLIFACIYIPTIKKEEALLQKQFGDAYDSYCHHTPRFFPRWHDLFQTRFWKNADYEKTSITSELRSMFATIFVIVVIKLISN